MEAQDIFGLDFDFDEFDKYGRDDFSSGEEEDEYEEEEDIEDGGLTRRKKKSTKKSIYEVSQLVDFIHVLQKEWVDIQNQYTQAWKGLYCFSLPY